MRPELIVMLTHYDETVKNALELFEECKDLPVKYWGFKDVGLPASQMKELVGCMKAAGKTTALEVVSLSEEEGLAGARLAVEGGFDILMGTVYYHSISDYLRGQPVRYYPFPGKISGHPSLLEGTIPEIAGHARFLQGQGVDGLDLLAYRYSGDVPELMKSVIKNISIPVICAGSIASKERIIQVREAGAWGFTIGSAFFEHKFVPDGGIRENIVEVARFLQHPGEDESADAFQRTH